MSARPLSEIMAPDWAEALQPVAARIASMGEFLRAEIAAGRGYLPAGENVLRAFRQPLAGVRVLLVGQDPYPTPGHPVGLSFSVAPDVRPVPRSLQNIYQELGTDLGLPTPGYLHVPLAVDADGRKLSKSADAPPVDLDDPRRTLAAALEFLDQAVPEAGDTGMLHAAARIFDPGRLRGVASRAADPQMPRSR